jgi:hypothetical protein
VREQQPQQRCTNSGRGSLVVVSMAAGEEEKPKGGLPFWLDPSTRCGGLSVLCFQ